MRHVLTVLFTLVLLASTNAHAQTLYPLPPGGEYDGFVLESHYVQMSDGESLAVDFYFPASSGVPFYEDGENLPPVYIQLPYHRRWSTPDGDIPWAFLQPHLLGVIAEGYVLVVADTRGSGASFGTTDGVADPTEIQDLWDMIDYLANASWSTGDVGMAGGSYLSLLQLRAAVLGHPSLRAIVPNVTISDFYELVYPGGILQDNFMRSWSFMRGLMDLGVGPIPPSAFVDEDPDGILYQQAIMDHLENGNIFDAIQSAPYRDSVAAVTEDQFFLERSPMSFLEEIDDSDVAILHVLGLMDIDNYSTLAMVNSLNNTQKVVIGPWWHQQVDVGVFTDLHVQWYDRFLKGIENGVEDGSLFTYAVMSAEELANPLLVIDPAYQIEWRTSETWPPDAVNVPLFLRRGFSGTVDSVNDGNLRLWPSFRFVADDEYTVDYSTTTGYPTRWTNAGEGPMSPMGYADMTANDERSLTYTSKALPIDVELAGHPVVRLWLKADAPDLDLFVYLEDVDQEGVSHLITEGSQRVSLRGTSYAPHDDLGLPYQRAYEEDVDPLTSDEMACLHFDLLPISYRVEVGHRIRVSITGADSWSSNPFSMGPNRGTPALDPPPTVNLYRGLLAPSYISLPVTGGSLP